MGEWNRSTIELPLEDIPPELAAEIQAHVESFNLGPILNDPLICIQTISEKKKQGLFGGFSPLKEKTTIGAYILTPEWLVFAVRGDVSRPAALSARLKDAQVDDYANSPAYQLLPDCGIHVTGIFTGKVGMNGETRVTIFIPLGEETAAKKFKETLFQAVQQTRQK